MSRSIFLRGYDQEMANMVVDHMDSLGTTFLRECRPLALEKSPSGSIHVTYQDADGQEKQEEYDTVLMAVGRVPSTDSLNLAAAGVESTPEGKIVAHDEKTSASNIYAIGDVVAGMPELTPVAIQAGRLLARRLYGGSEKRFDHRVVPTSVFTPLEYACCGVSEEEAIQQYGEEAIEVGDSFLSLPCCCIDSAAGFHDFLYSYPMDSRRERIQSVLYEAHLSQTRRDESHWSSSLWRTCRRDHARSFYRYEVRFFLHF